MQARRQWSNIFKVLKGNKNKKTPVNPESSTQQKHLSKKKNTFSGLQNWRNLLLGNLFYKKC